VLTSGVRPTRVMRASVFMLCCEASVWSVVLAEDV
jgi:hypothetical protein